MSDGESKQLSRLAFAFLDSVARARATSVVPVPGGIAVLNADFPLAHDLNRLIITAPCDPAELASAADDVLGGAGLAHRQIDVHDLTHQDELAAGLAAHGYTGSFDVLMADTGTSLKSAPDRPVIELGVSERAAVASAEWRREQPGWDDDTIDQLGRRVGTAAGATRATFFAIQGNGRHSQVVAHADLYERDGVAQIEEVMTDPAAQGRGLASRLVLHALHRARERGAAPVFLIANEDDWPRQLYRRLGFDEIGRILTFRTPHP
jgi:ribosomal protein S18 acetylase RimI-like enzyme